MTPMQTLEAAIEILEARKVTAATANDAWLVATLPYALNSLTSARDYLKSYPDIENQVPTQFVMEELSLARAIVAAANE